MTGQISDSITWQRKQYTLVGIDGGELFDPTQHGMAPVMWHTACYRGFVCRYEYRRINLRIPFVGRLLLGRDFDPQRYEHMGFQDWSAYRVVLEATVSGDSVIVVDRSPAELSTTPPEDPDDLSMWINRRFELDGDARGWP